MSGISSLSKLYKEEMACVGAVIAASKTESRLSVGDPALHWALGGWALNRVNLIFGPAGCLAGDTKVRYSVFDKDGNRKDHKGGTIERLYERFHNTARKGKGNYQRKVSKGCSFKITSVDENGRLILNDIEDVVLSGVKPCFEVKTAKGHVIVATEDHRFLTMDGVYVPLKDLDVGSEIRSFCGKKEKISSGRQRTDYQEWLVQYHPSNHTKTITESATGKEYTYCRVAEHRAIIEAEMNGMTTEAYRGFLNSKTKEEIDTLCFLDDNTIVHHKDENKKNNERSNLIVMSNVEHSKHHYNKDIGRSIVEVDFIESKVSVGDVKTYDICCRFPYNNFVANNVVVHNSGKSAYAAFGSGAAQKLRPGSVVMVTDTEFYFHEQPERVQRLEKFGININDLFIVSGNTVDEAFGKISDIEKLLESGKLDISAWIIDSWQGIENKSSAKKLDENKDGTGASDAGDAHRGNAKTMNPILVRILRLCAKYKITTFIVQHCMVNQEQYGPKYLLLGGEKLRHLCDTILFVESVAAKDAKMNASDDIAARDEIVVGKKIRGRVEKTRNTMEGKTVDFWVNFQECRFAKPEESLFDLARNLGVIYTPSDSEKDDDGNEIVDKKTGQVRVKEKKGWNETIIDDGVVSLYGRPAFVDKLRTDKNFFLKVQSSCMRSKNLVGSDGNASETKDTE